MASEQVDKNFDSYDMAKKMEYLKAVLADDLGSYVVPILTTLAKEYGPSILSWAYGKIKSRFNLRDHGSGIGILKDSTQAIPRSMDSITSDGKFLDLANLVDLNYISCVLCPEAFKDRLPDLNAQNTALYYNQTQLLLTNTRTDGNFIQYINLDNSLASGIGTYWYTATCLNVGTPSTASCNMTAGLATNYLYGVGPAFANLAAINSYRTVASSVRFVPSLSTINNQGTYGLIYQTDPSNSSLYGANPAIPSIEALNSPYVHIAAAQGTKEMRQVHTPHDITDQAMVNINNGLISNATQSSDVAYFFGIGGPLSTGNSGTTFGTMYYTVVLEDIPTQGGLGLQEVRPTPTAPGSSLCIGSIFKGSPHVSQLDLKDAIKLATLVRNLPYPHAGYVYREVCAFMSGYTRRPSDVPEGFGGGGGDGDLGLMSFDSN